MPNTSGLSFVGLGLLIAITGAIGAFLPAMITAGHPVTYLRQSAHGRKGTTTDYARLQRIPEHTTRNQLGPMEPSSDAQIPAIIPESGGHPTETDR